MSATSELYRGDCRDVLPTLPADSVQLIVTSPPYNVGWRYADNGDGDRLPLVEYQAMLSDVFAGCWRVLREGGVLALNVPPTIHLSDEERAWPLSAWCQLTLQQAGWRMRELLCWVKGAEGAEPVAQNTAWGAWTNPYLRPVHEHIILASKADYRMPHMPRWESTRRMMPWLKDVWYLPSGTAKRGDPLAFPDELVSHLVELLSAPGDVVLDPFAGTGTTGRKARMLERVAWLIEREPSYWSRLEAVLGQGLLFGEDVA